MALVIGILAKRSGLCMVKGVTALMAGRPILLIAILVCGFAFWFVVPFSIYPVKTINYPQYGANLLFFVGGLLFGLGAGFNQGCSVSTLTRLAQRDIRMLATVFGWALGWLLFANISFELSLNYPVTNYTSLAISPLILTSCAITLIVFMIHPKRLSLLTILLFGAISTMLTQISPHWSPSHYLQAITYTLSNPELSSWPTMSEHLIIALLLIGMSFGKKHSFIAITKKQFITHCSAGILMGIGASLALGGNDTQVLFALPALSLGGMLACFGIIGGIMIALKLITLRQQQK
ncbi:YeeE/YedE thiosulfate transporter family protein [Pseudoalteromonas haloplanktis]|uniref:YeeE/YedE thiosulfate transporter family protein n=1 Tax=Pseudoalteromonas haloplanktis TaxID=228 RepID=A0ABU1BBY9_PSEHA|nr:YeeE/YedE thiosulfate transporter family protein [Pseudoalteromonas haloplanktis]MDQ9091122.1 YeeE/YedE thiosulfate transporter family protein [Pseudoalteromonas haloplanktis]